MRRALFLSVFLSFGCSASSDPADGGSAVDTGANLDDAALPIVRGAVVASYHEQSTAAGIEILERGGNAFDAFIATTLVDYVVSPGVTSAAGPMGAMLYVASEGRTVHLDGDFAETREPARDDATPGAPVVVPGAVPALAALSERYGALPWRDVVEPAIRTARDGFVVDFIFHGSIAQTDVLERSEYGRAAYLPGGEAPPIGSTLRLPQLAAFFEEVAEHGAAYTQTGAWAEAAVDAVRAAGGTLAREDLADYRVEWREPRRTSYRGFEVVAPSGRAYGGLWGLVALEILERTPSAELASYPGSADGLERMLRVAHIVHGIPSFFDPAFLDDPARVEQLLSPASIDALASRVESQIEARGGSHSYHVIASDAEGNVITGTNTIVGGAFGEGIFVQGVPLTAGGAIVGYRTAPGERRISPFAIHLVLEEGRPVAALGAFGTSMIEVEAQMLVDAIDARLSGAAIAERPHFGTWPVNWDTGHFDLSANWIDERVSPAIRSELETRGVRVVVDPAADVGFGIALTFRGEVSGGALRTYNHPVAVRYAR